MLVLFTMTVPPVLVLMLVCNKPKLLVPPDNVKANPVPVIAPALLMLS